MPPRHHLIEPQTVVEEAVKKLILLLVPSQLLFSLGKIWIESGTVFIGH